MKISAYPKEIDRKEQYTAGDVAILYGVSHRTATQMIDKGELPGFTVPGSRERRVLHQTVVDHVSAHPQYQFVLNKIRSPEEN